MKRRRGTHRPVGHWGYLSAASTYHIYQDLGLGDSQPQNMPGTEWESRNLNNFLWGLIRQDLPITNCRLANGQRLGIEEIRVGRSFMQTLVTFLTLGLWAPARISWRCARPLSQSGTLD
jgi:hypothetical protein